MPQTRSTIPLTLVAGLYRDQTAGVARSVLDLGPGTVLVQHDLADASHGIVHRRITYGPTRSRSHPQIENATLELAHCCVSCTLREDVLPLIRQLARNREVSRIVLHLDPALEPESVCWCLQNVALDGRKDTANSYAHVDAVVAVLDSATWLDDATGDTALVERDLGAGSDDERSVSQVVVSQAEFADLIILGGAPAQPWTQARVHAVLDRLAPHTPRMHLATPSGHADDGARIRAAMPRIPADARRGRISEPHDRLLCGEPPLDSDCGVSLVLFSDPRPFHPARFQEAMSSLLDGVVRTRGRLWLASQPDVAFWLETAGGTARMGPVDPWLATTRDWDRVSAERRAMAALAWDERFGDRRQDLAVIAHDIHPDEVVATLGQALLTRPELAAGETAWIDYDDPFSSCHVDPDADAPSCETPLSPQGRDNT